MIIRYNNRGGRENCNDKEVPEHRQHNIFNVVSYMHIHTWHTQAISTVSDISTLNAMTIAHPIKICSCNTMP